MAEKEGSGPNTAESEPGDGEFEPTAEMLVNDFDDERTLEEEEAMEPAENQDDEVNNLTKEQNMPLEQLLAMYGSFPSGRAGEGNTNVGSNGEISDNPSGAPIPDNEEEEEEDGDASRSSASEEIAQTMAKDPKSEGNKPEKRKKGSELTHIYPDLDANGEPGGGATSRSLRSGSRQQSEDEDDEGEEGSGEEEEDWRKTIMIGTAYQASIPEGLQAYDATPPYENEDKLLWEPGRISPSQVEEYLGKIGHAPAGAHGIDALPMGAHTRDNEQALHLLLQCGYNVEEALRRYRMNPGKVASCMTLWSEEECRNFENGLKTYGKDFHLIQQNKVRTRSVGELVQFYYLWKKTERHDMFATKTRIEKKKYFVHPGTTDYMDRFLDEGEGITVTGNTTSTTGGMTLTPLRDFRAGSPGIHSLLYGKCPPGVHPPIPTSTLSSATLSFVTTSAFPHQDLSQMGLSQGNSPNLATSNTNANASTQCVSSVGSSSHLGSTKLATRSSSPRLNQSSLLEGVSVHNNAGSANTSKHNVNSSQRGTKRSHSPTVDMNVSISHSLTVRSPSGALGIDTKSHSKAETVAL